MDGENPLTFGEIMLPKPEDKRSVKFHTPSKADGDTTLFKSLTDLLNGGEKENSTVERLAFQANPNDYISVFSGLYQQRTRLIPDEIKKRISIQDSLVSAILAARQNQMSSFGRPQPDRFSSGFKIELKQGISDSLTEEETELLTKKISELEKRLMNCGKKTQYTRSELMTFSDFLAVQTRNALVFGKVATEIVYDRELKDGFVVKKFHSFRPIDAGTIYPVPKIDSKNPQLTTVRDQGLAELEKYNDTHIDPELFRANKYAWVQVIDNRPREAFTETECVVKNFYPVSDIELHGFPVAPIDTVISDITMHLNITTHNKLYFQNGRASRGIMVIKSSNVNQKTIAGIEKHFRASINNASNSWRTPVITMDEESEVEWLSLDPGHRDMEFQFLSDSNSRVILSAFQMSPDEIPGYGHLSRGTNQQTLSESNNEYKLTAARDVGIRPLISKFQDLVIQGILPFMDDAFPLEGQRLQTRKLSEFITFRFVGLESSSYDKETEQLNSRIDLDMSMNDILEKSEKENVPDQLGGNFIFNSRFQAVLDKYVKVGVILESVFGMPGAAQDPQYDYVRDEFWFRNREFMQAQAQAQMAAQQPQQIQDGQPEQESASDAREALRQLHSELKGKNSSDTSKLEELLSKLNKALDK